MAMRLFLQKKCRPKYEGTSLFAKVSQNSSRHEEGYGFLIG